MTTEKIFRFLRNMKIFQTTVVYKSIQFPPKDHKCRTFSKKYFIGTPFTLMGIWSFVKTKNENETVVTTREVLLAKADALFEQGQYKDIYDLLSNYRDSGDVEVMWRLTRTLYYMSKTANEVEAKKMIYEGYDLISTAISIKEDHSSVHKWMCIFIDAKCSYEGIEARLNQLYIVKQHMMRASELNPSDPTILYMLGSWCYQLSDLAWYQRKIIGILFEKAPVSSYEEALTYFENAEKLEPNFYSHNLLMLGKTLLKLNRKEEAIPYLKRAAEFCAKNDEDHEAKREAQKILNSI